MVKKKALFSSSEDCCIFRNSFPFVQWCRLPMRRCSALRCGSAWQAYVAQIALKNHYGKMLRLEVKQHGCKLHLRLEIFFFFLVHTSSAIIQILSGPALCKSNTHELCLLCHLANPISFFGVVHVPLGTLVEDNEFLQIAVQEKYR